MEPSCRAKIEAWCKQLSPSESFVTPPRPWLGEKMPRGSSLQGFVSMIDGRCPGIGYDQPRPNDAPYTGFMRVKIVLSMDSLRGVEEQ